jgi:dTDP-4-amino-4,6-dideoxygalactose transaminase
MSREVEFTDIYVDDAIVERVAEVLRSGRYVKGPVLEDFEAEFAAATGVDHAVGVSNGTAALLLAMKALDIGAGDEVFVPAHTYFATVSPVLELGAKPVFVDIDPERYTMDPEELRSAVAEAENPAAVVVTHMHGQPADMDPIVDIATGTDLALVEDAAQAHLATCHDERVGSFGDAGCFSFYPTKNMTVGGDGGMITTDDQDMASRARALRNHGRDESGEHVTLGLNHRLDETNAAVGREQLERLPDWNAARRAVAARYDDLLADVEPVETPTTTAGSEHVYHHYAVQVPDRPSFRAYLGDNGIATQVHYEKTASQHEAVRTRVEPAATPVASDLLDRLVSLPMHPRLTDEEIEYVGETIRGYYA